MDEKQIGLVGQMTPGKEAHFNKPLIAVYFEIDWKRNPKVIFFQSSIVDLVILSHIG